MTIQMPTSPVVPASNWTGLCATEHGVGGTPHARSRAEMRSSSRSVTRSADRPANGIAGTDRVRPIPARRSQASRPVSFERTVQAPRPGVVGRSNQPTPASPGRRVLVRPGGGNTACRVQAPQLNTGVVDDVPTWALVVCGVLFGLAMLLALAFLGGPAYA